MRFSFKNMSQYVRNVIEPFMKANSNVQLAKISDVNNRLTKLLQEEVAALSTRLHTELSEYKEVVDKKLDIQQKTIEAFPVIQVGTIVLWPFARNPSDMAYYLECNGQAINASIYPELYALVGARVPDLRGLFLRGYGSQVHTQNNGSLVGATNTTHSSGDLLQVQGDAIRNITGDMGRLPSSDPVNTRVFSVYRYGGNGYMDGGSGRYTNFDASRVTPTASEIRPANMAVRYLMRAKP